MFISFHIPMINFKIEFQNSALYEFYFDNFQDFAYYKIVILSTSRYILIYIPAMLVDIDSIINKLILFQTPQVQKARAQLNDNFLSMGLNFMNLILQIMQKQQVKDWIKICASSYVNSVINQFKSQFSEQKISQILRQMIISQQIPQTCKTTLQRSIVTIMSQISNDQLEKWMEITQRLLYSHNQKKIIGYFLINCFAITELEDQFLFEFVKKNYEKSMQLCPFYQQLINGEIRQDELLSTIQTTKMCFRHWKIMINKLLQQKTPQKTSIIQLIANNNITFYVIDGILGYQSPPELMICINHQFATQINEMKEEALQFFERLIFFANREESEATYHAQNQKIWSFLLSKIEALVKTLGVVGIRKNIIEDSQCQQYIKFMLRILGIFITKNPENFGQEVWINIHEMIIYPLLEATQQQRLDFDERPQQFNMYIQDCCDKQTFDTLKSECSKLLETIGDQINASILYSCNRAVWSIYIKLKNYGQSPQYMHVETKLTTSLRPLQIQQSFLILSLFSYRLQRFVLPQLHESLKMLMRDQRLLKMPPFQTSRLFLFLAYNFSDVFKHDLFEGKRLIQLALNYNTHTTTIINALDFLNNIVDEYFSQEFFDIILKKIYDEKENCDHTMRNAYNKEQFNILNRMIHFHCEQFTEEMRISLIDHIYQRIMQEVTTIQILNEKASSKKAETHSLIYCLNCLLKFLERVNQLSDAIKIQFSNSEKQDYDPFLQTKQYIWKVSDFLEQAFKYDLDQDIIKIISQFLKGISVIKPNTIFISQLPTYLELFKKRQYIGTPYFIMFNHYIMKYHGKQIELLCKCLLSGLMYHSMDLSQKAKYSLQKITIAHHLLLLQNLIAVHGIDFTDYQIFNHIVAVCYKFFPDEPRQKTYQQSNSSKNKLYILSKTILARALNLLMLCHMHLRNEDNLIHLSRLHHLRIFAGYDLKILLQLLEKQIFRQRNIQTISSYLNIIVNVITLQQKDQKKLIEKKQDKKKEVSTVIKLKRSQDYQLILKHITTPFKQNILEKQFVINLFKLIKESSLTTYHQILQEINPKTKDWLQKATQSQHIDNKQKKRVIMHVKGIKAQNTNNVHINQKMKSKAKRAFEISERLQIDTEDNELMGKKARKMNKIQATNKRNNEQSEQIIQ